MSSERISSEPFMYFQSVTNFDEMFHGNAVVEDYLVYKVGTVYHNYYQLKKMKPQEQRSLEIWLWKEINKKEDISRYHMEFLTMNKLRDILQNTSWYNMQFREGTNVDASLDHVVKNSEYNTKKRKRMARRFLETSLVPNFR